MDIKTLLKGIVDNLLNIEVNVLFVIEEACHLLNQPRQHTFMHRFLQWLNKDSLVN